MTATPLWIQTAKWVVQSQTHTFTHTRTHFNGTLSSWEWGFLGQLKVRDAHVCYIFHMPHSATDKKSPQCLFLCHQFKSSKISQFVFLNNKQGIWRNGWTLSCCNSGLTVHFHVTTSLYKTVYNNNEMFFFALSPPPMRRICEGFLRQWYAGTNTPRDAAPEESEAQTLVTWPQDRAADQKLNFWRNTLLSNNMNTGFLPNSRQERDRSTRVSKQPRSPAHSTHTFPGSMPSS